MRESVLPRRAIAGVAGVALLALILVGKTLRGRGGALVELEQKASARGEKQAGAAVHKAQSLIHRERPGYIEGRRTERDLVPGLGIDGQSSYRPPDTSQAEHATIADRGFWWGDNDAWHDGWTQHKKDMRKMRYIPPRFCRQSDTTCGGVGISSFTPLLRFPDLPQDLYQGLLKIGSWDDKTLPLNTSQHLLARPVRVEQSTWQGLYPNP